MALNHSPAVVTNGLVYYHDMGNTQKSWKGAPAVNLFGTNLTVALDQKTLSGVTYNGYRAVGVGNDNPRNTLFTGSLTVAASTFYTLSCLYWSSNNIVDDVYLYFTDAGWPESTNYIQPFTSQSVTRNGSFSITDLGGGWKYCVGTFQTLATTTTLGQIFFDVDIAGVEVFIANIQLEQNTFATPYVAGTRTNTQAIVDLTGNNTVTATSLTYANNEFSFNGGTDTAYISNTIPIPNNSFTISAWVNSSAVSGAQNILSMNGPYFMRITGSTVRFNVLAGGTWLFQQGTTVLSNNTWYYLSMVYDYAASTWSGYINGKAEFSVAKSGTLSVTSFYGYIGYTPEVGEQAAFNGKISAIQIYNRALSAAEVKQNFNALRGRYGL